MSDGHQEVNGKLSFGSVLSRILFWAWQSLSALWLYGLIKSTDLEKASSNELDALSTFLTWVPSFFVWGIVSLIFWWAVRTTRPGKVLVIKEEDTSSGDKPQFHRRLGGLSCFLLAGLLVLSLGGCISAVPEQWYSANRGWHPEEGKDWAEAQCRAKAETNKQHWTSAGIVGQMDSYNDTFNSCLRAYGYGSLEERTQPVKEVTVK